MAEENLSREKSRETKTTLEKIESLIVDGQKEVLGKIVEIDVRLGGGMVKLEEGQKRLEDNQERLWEKMKEVHSSLKNEIEVTAVAVKETVKEEIKRVENKLDEHMRLPVHVGV